MVLYSVELGLSKANVGVCGIVFLFIGIGVESGELRGFTVPVKHLQWRGEELAIDTPVRSLFSVGHGYTALTINSRTRVHKM